MADNDRVDYGPELIEQMQALLRIEERWTETIDRGFRWWGHRLRQTIWADPPERVFRDWTTCLRTETVVVDGYDDDDEAAAVLAVLNQRAIGHAYYLEPESRSVRSHTSLHWDGLNTYRLALTTLAVVYQLILAEQVAEGLAAGVGGSPAISVHPVHGERQEGHEILGHLTADRAYCDAALPARVAPFDLNALAEVIRRAYVASAEPEALAVEVSPGGKAMRVEFPMLFTALGGLIEEPKLGGGRPVVASYGHHTHPEAGSGILLRVDTPIVLEEVAGARLADRLNRDAATDGRGVDLRGAWCSRHGQVGYRSFLPGAGVRQIMPRLDQAKARVSMLHSLFDPAEQRLRLARLGDICRSLAVTGDGPLPAEADGADTIDVDAVTGERRAATIERLATTARDAGPFRAGELLHDVPAAAPVARFGRFDPANPALVTLDLLGVEASGELLLVRKLRHPASPQTWVEAVLPAGTTLASETMGGAIREVIVGQAGQDAGPIPGAALPDFVDLDYGDPDAEAHLRASFLALAEGLAAGGAVDLEAITTALEHYRHDPWARLQKADIDAPPPPDRPPGATPAERWWLAVTDEVNVFAHQYHLPDAWERATGVAGKDPAAPGG